MEGIQGNDSIQSKQSQQSFSVKLVQYIKGTPMQIWKSPYVFVFMWKQYPENVAFLILRILQLFAREVCKFIKK